ncbi:MAG: rhomboid family intramembrane serine protease [Hyphomicrobium sp.]
MGREPIFNVPGSVLAVLAVCAGVLGLAAILPVEDADRFIISLAFIPARYSGGVDIPGGDLASVTSFFTHIFTHAGLMHLVINGAWLLAFGSILSRRIGPWRFLAFFLAGGVAGALSFLALNWGAAVPVVGASGAIAALMGAVMRFLFVALDSRQGYLLRENPGAIPAMGLAETLTDRRIVISTALFIAINLLAMIGFGRMDSSAGGIAWEAHLGGYAFGLLAFGAFDVATHNASPSAADVE